MGWWEKEISFESMIDSALWYIEMKLEPWIDNIVYVAISGLGALAGIGSSLWDDLELWLDQRIEDFLPEVLQKIVGARNLAQYLHDTLKIELERKIDSLSGLPAQTIELVLTKLEPKIVSARQYAEYLTDNLDIEIGKQIKGVKTYAKSLQREVLADVDRRIAVVTASMASMDTVAGKARTAFYNSLKSIIDEVEQEAKDHRAVLALIIKKQIALLENSTKVAREVLEKSLKNAITSLDNSSKVARVVLEKTLNKSLDLLEREAKEAREVLEGTLIQIIEGVEDALEIAITDLERAFRGLLNVVIDRVDVLEGWVNNFAAIFDKELDKYQSRVVSWIVDGFEGILDRVFK